MFKKKNEKKEENKENKEYKSGQPLSFYKKETVVTTMEVDEGIAHFCCSRMEKACTGYSSKRRTYYSNFYGTYKGKKNKIGCYTHNYHDYDENKANFEAFDFCPFCGIRINGYVEKKE